MKRLLVLCWLMFILAACNGSPATPEITRDVQESDEESLCEEIVTTTLSSLNTICTSLGRNQACYGNTLIESSLRDTASDAFDTPGDVIDVDLIERMSLSSFDFENGNWGFAIMQIQADLPDTLPGQNVTFLLFGGTEITPQGTIDGLQAYYVRTGVGEFAPCNAVPDDGIIIQTPNNEVEVHFSLNGVEFALGSTAYIQAEPDAEMLVNLIEGQAIVSAEGESQTVIAGARTRVSLDANGIADGAPSEPEPYEAETIRSLPVASLSRSVVPAAPARITPTVREQGSALLSTVDNPQGGFIEGEISAIGQEDVYELELGAGQIIFIDGDDIGADSIWYEMFDTEGNQIASWTLGYDNRRVEIAEAGVYTLNIYGINDNVGAYQLRVWDVPEDTVETAEITVPNASEHEGELTVPGEYHVYGFDLNEGDILFVNGIDVGADGIWYELSAPDETHLNNWTLENENRRFEIEQTGTYSLTVYGNEDSIGAYAFNLWGVPEDTVETLIVTQSEATEAEGDLGIVGEHHIYQFELATGDILFVNGIDVGADGIWYELFAPDETRLNNWTLENENRRFEIEQTGTYSLTVYGIDDSIGAYAFNLWGVPDDTVQSVTITAGEATEIEGELLIQGEHHVYEFELSEGDILFMDGIDVGADGIWYELFAPDETRVMNWILESDNRRIEIEQTGTYSLTVYGIDDAIGAYAFNLWGVEDSDSIDAELDEELAGELRIPGQIDRYIYDLQAGQALLYEAIDTATSSIRWQLLAPDGSVATSSLFAYRDFDFILPEQSGEYTLEVFGGEDSIGSYSFRLVEP